MIRRLRLCISTLLALGMPALYRVAVYRLYCRIGIYRLRMPIHHWHGSGNFFSIGSFTPAPAHVQESSTATIAQSEAALQGRLVYYSHTMHQVGAPPDWFFDPISQERPSVATHWSQINEFSGADIKNIWEASRFEWLTLFARAWRYTGDKRYLSAMNSWLADWLENNPLNSGPNWKCGQETSIRLINLLLSARLLGCHQAPSQQLIDCVALHCKRIVPTLGYAVGQNNNHGTSEAAALYIGGSWIRSVTSDTQLQRTACKWQMSGRLLLEDRIRQLVATDGSFSQYSSNYHRVLLDTISQVEVWRRELQDVTFSSEFSERCQAAATWLFDMTDAISGDVPNLGANDGARLYNLSTASYRDFRPSVQLAVALFHNRDAFGTNGSWNDSLHWFGFSIPENAATRPISHQLDSGGYALLRRAGAFVLLRYPRFKFRPSHADALHIDLWHKGENVFRDAGTYSYNTDGRWLKYFSGTESHNTVQFDGRDQMPKISRFLFGNWLTTDFVNQIVDTSDETSISAAYYDSHGSYHHRTVVLKDNGLLVEDSVRGFQKNAVLRWRLRPGDWRIEGNTVTDGEYMLRIMTSTPFIRFELIDGWESLHYLEKNNTPVLEVEVNNAATFDTKLTWLK